MSRKLTRADLEKKIVDKQFHHFEGTTVTICLLTLENGYNMHGYSACVDPNNFVAELGQDYAYEDAVDKLWEIEGYLLKQEMFIDQQKEQA